MSKLECQSCGGNSITSLPNKSYQCQKCGAGWRLRVESPKPKSRTYPAPVKKAHQRRQTKGK